MNTLVISCNIWKNSYFNLIRFTKIHLKTSYTSSLGLLGKKYTSLTLL